MQELCFECAHIQYECLSGHGKNEREKSKTHEHKKKQAAQANINIFMEVHGSFYQFFRLRLVRLVLLLLYLPLFFPFKSIWICKWALKFVYSICHCTDATIRSFSSVFNSSLSSSFYLATSSHRLNIFTIS